MRNLLEIARQFRDDDSGAAMIEYTILIGIVTATTIAAVIGIGNWMTGALSNLCTALDGVAANAAGCSPS